MTKPLEETRNPFTDRTPASKKVANWWLHEAHEGKEYTVHDLMNLIPSVSDSAIRNTLIRLKNEFDWPLNRGGNRNQPTYKYVNPKVDVVDGPWLTLRGRGRRKRGSRYYTQSSKRRGRYVPTRGEVRERAQARTSATEEERQRKIGQTPRVGEELTVVKAELKQDKVRYTLRRPNQHRIEVEEV